MKDNNILINLETFEKAKKYWLEKLGKIVQKRNSGEVYKLFQRDRFNRGGE